MDKYVNIDLEDYCNKSNINEKYILLTINEEYKYIVPENIIKSIDYFNIMYFKGFKEYKEDVYEYNLNIPFEIPSLYILNRIINAIFCVKYSKTSNLLTFVYAMRLLDFLSIYYGTYVINDGELKYGKIAFEINNEYKEIISEDEYTIDISYVKIDDINPVNINFIKEIITEDNFLEILFPGYYDKLDYVNEITSEYFNIIGIKYSYASDTFLYLINKSQLHNIIYIKLDSHDSYKYLIHTIKFRPRRIDLVNVGMNIYFDDYIFSFIISKKKSEKIAYEYTKNLINFGSSFLEYYYKPYSYENIMRDLFIDVDKDINMFNIICFYDKDLNIKVLKDEINHYSYSAFEKEIEIVIIEKSL